MRTMRLMCTMRIILVETLFISKKNIFRCPCDFISVAGWKNGNALFKIGKFPKWIHSKFYTQYSKTETQIIRNKTYFCFMSKQSSDRVILLKNSSDNITSLTSINCLPPKLNKGCMQILLLNMAFLKGSSVLLLCDTSRTYFNMKIMSTWRIKLKFCKPPTMQEVI